MKREKVHISGSTAWLQSEENKSFPTMKELLEHIGCVVTPRPVESETRMGVTVPNAMFDVEFPSGSKVIKSHREYDGRKGSGPRNLAEYKGQILVPGDDCDFIVTYNIATMYRPEFFGLGVNAVEKD